MVDTMTICHSFKSYEDYKEIFKTIREQAKRINPAQPLHTENGKQITYAFAGYGISEWVFKKNRRIYIKLRPKLMIESGNYDDVLNVYDIPELYKKFKNIMNELNVSGIADLRIWQVKRIDYAVDIIVQQEMIPAYIKLFHKGNIRELLLSGDTSRRYKDAGNNLYLVSGNCCVNFYDRYTTSCLKRNKNPDKYKNADNRYGTLRFEIQLRKPNVSKMKKRRLIRNNTVSDFLDISICKYYILKYYDEIIGKGDYYPYYEALSRCKSDVRKNTLCFIHNEGSVHKAKETFINQGDNKRKRSKQFSKLINSLEKAGINPVTTDGAHIENLYDKLLYAIEGSNRFQIKRRKIHNER
ncbi:MAG: hypothetical protein J1F64_10085 [Oscillospiraceae bacterium]|nr:hypothetical protein [Oscillospiraceae bacterium]